MSVPGSPQLTRLESDITSVVFVFSTLDGTIQAHSIKECYHLGQFDPKGNNTKPRPILVHFVRMSDVSTILSKRGSLTRPYSVKPIMSKEQRKNGVYFAEREMEPDTIRYLPYPNKNPRFKYICQQKTTWQSS